MDRSECIFIFLSKFVVVMALICFLSSAARAASLCPSQVGSPTTFSVDSIKVRLEGEAEFHEIESSNFCYTTQDFNFPGVEGLGYYLIGLSTQVTSMTPDYPDGSEFKVMVTNLDSSVKFGGVVAVGDETRAVYGDEHGASSDQLTIVARSIDTTGNYSCVSGTLGYSGPQLFIATVPSRGKLTSTNEYRVVNSKSILNPLGFPLLSFDSESVQFALDYTFQGCRNEDRPYDSFIDGFYPKNVLEKGGISSGLLSFLDDQMLPLLFSASASSGMKVTSLDVRKSYGERQSEDGAATSEELTGLIIRMELQNDGWSGLQSAATATAQIGIKGRTGGFRIKPSARKAIKACTAKRKKMKKGYAFKRKGRNIVCQAKRR